MHLQQEVNELLNDIRNYSPDAHLEFADCFILLFGAAKAYNIDYEELCDAINHKMEVNKKRKWGEPDADGVVKHIPEF